MDKKFAFGIVVAIAAVGAGAALVRWPYNFLAELVLCACIFACLIMLGVIVINHFYQKSSELIKICSIATIATVSGAYIMLSTIYFAGFLSDTYPLSQKKLNDQQQKIAALSHENEQLNENLKRVSGELADATKVLSDPLSVPEPSYFIATSLRLQFNRTGDPKEIDSSNVSWREATVDEAQERQPSSSAAATPSEQSSAISQQTCGVTEQIEGKCQTPLWSLEAPACPTITCPVFETNKSQIIFLYFPRPIAAKSIELNSYGSYLPHNAVIGLDNRTAILWFDSVPKSVAINIIVEQEHP